MIDIGTKSAIIDALEALDDASLLPVLVRKDALPGALAATNSYLATLTVQDIAAELQHILDETYILVGGHTRWGWTASALLAAVDGLKPTVESTTPADEATDVALDTASVTVVFDIPVTLSTGSFHLWLDDTEDTLVQSWGASDLTFDGTDTVTLPIDENLTAEAVYFLAIDAAAVRSAADGMPNNAVASATSFTAAAA